MAFKMTGMSFGEGTGYQSPQKTEAARIKAKQAKARALKTNITEAAGSSATPMTGDNGSPQKVVPLLGAGALAARTAITTGARAFAGKKLKKGLKTKIVDGVTKVLDKAKGWIVPTAAYYIGKATGKKDDEGKKEETTTTTTTSEDKGKGTKSTQMPDADWKKGQEKAKSKGHNLDALVKKRKGLEKGSDEWKRNQNKINEALGSSKRYDVGPAKTTTTATTGTKDVPRTITPQVTVEKKRGHIVGDKKLEFETYDDGGRKAERKTKGRSIVEGKKIKQRNYEIKTGDLTSKVKEKYRKKKGGAEGGMAEDFYKDKMKKQKITTKGPDTVTKTKTKYDKEGKVKRQVTKTRKRRWVGIGKALAGKRAGQRT